MTYYNIDKNLKKEGIMLPPSTPQPEVETKPVASQPVDFSKAGSQEEIPQNGSQPIDMTGGRTPSDRPMVEISSKPMREDVIYTVKKGDTLWNVTKNYLIESGIQKPSSAEIMQAMQLIAEANGCNNVDECRIKFFSKIGSELNVTALFGEQNQDGTSSTQSASEVSGQAKQESVLTQEEQQLAAKLKEKYPDLEIDKMPDIEMKKMLDNFRENKPEIIEALAKAVSAEGAEVVKSSSVVDEETGAIAQSDAEIELASSEQQISGQAVIQDGDIKSSVQEYLSSHASALKPNGGSVEKSELEVLAEQTGLEGDFDEIIFSIRSKPKADLTPTQLELLNKYDAQINSSQNVSSPEEVSEEKQMLAMIQRMLDSGFANLPPEKQTFAVVQAFLTKNDKVYQGLKTEEEKAKYLDNAIKDLQKMSASGEDATGLFALFKDNLSMIRSMVLLQYAEKSGKSIEDLKNMKPQERTAIISAGENKAIGLGIKLIQEQAGEKLAKASEEEKVKIYADAILSLLDKEYANMPEGKVKEEYREKAIEQFATQLFKGKSFNGKSIDISKGLKNPKIKEELYLQISYSLDYIANTKSNKDFVSRIKEFNITDPEARNGMIMKMLRAKMERGNFNEDDKKRLIKSENYDAIIKRYRKIYNDNKHPDNAQAAAILDIMIDEAKRNGASPDELKDLEAYREQLNFKIAAGRGNDLFVPRLSLADEAAAKDMKLFKYYEVQFENMEPHTKEFENTMKEVVIERFGNVKDARVLCDFLKQKGYSDVEIAKFIRDNIPVQVYAHIMTEPPTSEDYAYMQKLMNGTQDEEVLATEQKFAVMQARNDYGYTQAERVTVGAAIAGDERLHSTYQEALVAYNSREDVSYIMNGINNSGEVSEANISLFNKTFISETLKNDSDRLYYGQTLSQNTSNSAALEGLAAASNSVSDPGMRDQYNSHISSAASNLPPEDQSRINTAMQTGEISKETLSKTSTNSSSSTQESSKKEDAQKSSSAKDKEQQKAQGSGQQQQQVAAAKAQNQQAAPKAAQSKAQQPQSQTQAQQSTAHQQTQQQAQNTQPTASQAKVSGQAATTAQTTGSSSSSYQAKGASSSVAVSSTGSVQQSSQQPQAVSGSDDSSTVTGSSAPVYSETPMASPSADYSSSQYQETISSSSTDYSSPQYQETPTLSSSGTFQAVGGSQVVSGSAYVEDAETQGVYAVDNTSTMYANEDPLLYEVQASEAMRQEVLAKIEQFQENVRAAVEEWENRHRKLTTEEGELINAGIAIDAAVEAINSSSLNEEEKKVLFEQVAKASSIDEIYEILITKSVNLEVIKDKVLELLGTSSSSESVRNVVTELISDESVVKELFKRSSSSSVKKELLSMMSTDTVVELLASKQIKNLGDVDHKILRSFIEKNIYSMSNTDFNEYLKHLPLDDRLALVELRKDAKGGNKQVVTPPPVDNHDADMVTINAEDKDSQNPGHVVPEYEKPVFSAGQISMKQGGKVITQVGTTFVVENADQFDSEEPEYGTAAWKEKYGEMDAGMVALYNQNDLYDLYSGNPNFAQMGDGNVQLANWKRRNRKGNKGLNFFS